MRKQIVRFMQEERYVVSVNFFDEFEEQLEASSLRQIWTEKSASRRLGQRIRNHESINPAESASVH